MSNTKQAILDASLDLFSKSGYNAVSIRDICKVVGIKESSVYYHFANKRAIFDALKNGFLERCNVLQTRLETKLAEGNVEALDGSFFQKVCRVHVDGLLLDGFVNAFVRILAIERFSDDDAAALYNKFMIDDPLAYQSGTFAYLMQLGVLPQQDCKLLAVRYYAPILLFYERYMLCGAQSETQKQLFLDKVNSHITDFISD
ncbi:MAG: TetR/AcrR family transcriptional regulator [Corallococcus sp.]|nr:TetR/AcrR family transcriptional regulator [Corallococcus sp.]MCM1359769.1 TetR/AcrR family transcriptional regulator [Corallococcus sp.]MCM1395705.1 TetR/AcrR family transcriptional regulator [Corallococcus sp.]